MDHKLSASVTLNRSEEDLLDFQAKSESFWDIGNYKKVVKRIDDGARLCGDLIKMAQERAEIEAKYARHLQAWIKKWEDIVSKGPEYGSLEAGWKATFRGASRTAEVHSDMCRKIQDDIVESVHTWKNENYHKSLMALKESKKADEYFSRAQKPWEKRLAKSSRCRKNYHQAGRDLDTLEAALHEAETNDNISPEQCSKVRDKTERAQRDFEKALDKYKDRLGDVQHYKSRYIEDMTMEFSKCQEMELARITFFKNTLLCFKETLDTTKKAVVKEISREYGQTLSQVNAEEDLRWYAVNYGTGMNYNWPEFEEYIPGQPASKPTTHTHSPHVQHHTISTATTRHTSSSLSSHTHSMSGGSSSNPQSRPSEHGSSSTSSSPTLQSYSNRTYEVIGFDCEKEDQEDDWLEPPPAEVHPIGATGSRSSSEEPQGQLMRAIYDYAGSQEDDITFSEGDLVRIMYEGKDGWAEGMLGDKYGYVPIAYFEPVL